MTIKPNPIPPQAMLEWLNEQVAVCEDNAYLDKLEYFTAIRDFIRLHAGEQA